MSKQLRVPADVCQIELEIKKSRFICQLWPCDNKQSAKMTLTNARKQFPEANHHCWAYQIGPQRSLLQACSDDGEPHGTAGRPMLNVLTHGGVTNIIAVVSRIFGGTKLGTGGLARAYSQAVKEALLQLKTEALVQWQKLHLEFEYPQENQVRHVLEQYKVKLDKIEHQATVTMHGRVNLRHSNACIDDLVRLVLAVECLE